MKNIKRPIRVYRVELAPEAAGQIIGEHPTASTVWARPALMAATAVVFLVVLGSVAVCWSRSPDEEPPAAKGTTFPLPDKPSIAVLPFNNLSRNTDQDCFSDGSTENIITALSQVSSLLVIARKSTFAYKRKPVEVQEVAADLGVCYVLEGSDKKSGDTVRIPAQLIDALRAPSCGQSSTTASSPLCMCCRTR